eukprot:gnl/Chilomastix_caulleri/8971.p1 GENE.gnl/Chilomastix_caulleri/8971~~gnl/Chilomastix_caulleri/8971.p1  ORF type:complete len:50 (+),score=2.70 gnl/Chilomastix_caulleri/8971:211-360(+)
MITIKYSLLVLVAEDVQLEIFPELDSRLLKVEDISLWGLFKGRCEKQRK